MNFVQQYGKREEGDEQLSPIHSFACLHRCHAATLDFSAQPLGGNVLCASQHPRAEAESGQFSAGWYDIREMRLPSPHESWRGARQLIRGIDEVAELVSGHESRANGAIIYSNPISRSPRSTHRSTRLLFWSNPQQASLLVFFDRAWKLYLNWATRP